jgi:cbb3-type cytochrome oxidase subunit 3
MGIMPFLVLFIICVLFSLLSLGKRQSVAKRSEQQEQDDEIIAAILPTIDAGK